MNKFWPTLNLSAIESAKCRSEFHKLSLALLDSASKLASSYEFRYNFTWPVRHFPHPAMISTAHSFSCPTALAVALGGWCNVPKSLNVHLMHRSSLMTAGQDRSIWLRGTKLQEGRQNFILQTFVICIPWQLNWSNKYIQAVDSKTGRKEACRRRLERKKNYKRIALNGFSGLRIRRGRVFWRR
jgi:hypothetical protein